jgi:hypothetical protein
MIPPFYYFNSLQPDSVRSEANRAIGYGKILVNIFFLENCLDRDLLAYGINLGDLVTVSPDLPSLEFRNYDIFFPDIDLFDSSRSLLLTKLRDLGMKETSVEEVKERVNNWIFNKVVPIYLEKLFS